MDRFTDTTVSFEGTEYPITPDTAAALRSGTVPKSLLDEIHQNQGEESRREFLRWCRLRRRILDQIKQGEQPGNIRDVIEDYILISQILYKLYHHNLVQKAEKLHGRGLLSDAVLQTVREQLLTLEIVPPLTQAIQMDIALYLFQEEEINQETLDGFRNRTIDFKLIRTINYYHHSLIHAQQTEAEKSFPVRRRPDGSEYRSEPLASDSDTVAQRLLDKQRNDHLQTALSWLTQKDRDLIQQIYFDHIPITELALQAGCNERNIRYHRDKALKKLRLIYQEVLCLPVDEIFD